MPSIVGTWRLAKAEAHDANGKPLLTPYGGKGMGRVTFNAEGRMAAVVVDTHAAVWYLAQDPKLSQKAMEALDSATQAGERSCDLRCRTHLSCGEEPVADHGARAVDRRAG